MDGRNDQRTAIWHRVIPGSPVTKKNHSRIVSVRGKKIIIPSKPYLDWLDNCGNFVLAHQIGHAVSCTALIYRVANRGDAVNYYQAIADMLEHYDVVTNDSLIVHWDGSRLLKDAANPRLDLTLYAVGN